MQRYGSMRQMRSNADSYFAVVSAHAGMDWSFGRVNADMRERSQVIG